MHYAKISNLTINSVLTATFHVILG